MLTAVIYQLQGVEWSSGDVRLWSGVCGQCQELLSAIEEFVKFLHTKDKG